MDPEPTIDAMRTAAQALRSGDARERARAIQVAQDALDAAKAMALSELQISRDHELDGASTLNAWVRNELRLNAGQATALVRNVSAL
ncbi:MAG: HNH endonuclease, partial [Aeromicrobium sp.]